MNIFRKSIIGKTEAKRQRILFSIAGVIIIVIGTAFAIYVSRLPGERFWNAIYTDCLRFASKQECSCISKEAKRLTELNLSSDAVAEIAVKTCVKYQE